MINILILEDDLIQRKSLARIVEKIDKQYVVYQADNMEEGLKIAKEKKISLFYVDITLRNSSGLDFAKEIRAKPQYKLTWIIFITTHVKHMLEAFKEIHCYDYIIKPYEKEKVEEVTLTLLKCGQTTNLSPQVEEKYVIFGINGVSLKLSVNEIVFVEVCFRTSIVHTKTGKYEIKNMPLKKVKEMMKEFDFIQVHRAYIVNLNLIKVINRTASPWSIQCQNYEGTIPIGDKFKKATFNAFETFLGGYYE